MGSKTSFMLRACGTLILGAAGGMISHAIMHAGNPPPLPAANPTLELDRYPKDALTDRQIDAVDFDNVKLADLLEAFGRSQNLHIVCKWDSLDEWNIAPDQLITMHLKKPRLGEVFGHILAIVNPDREASWIEQDGTIIIAPQQDVELVGPVVERLYDVRPLFVVAQQFTVRFPTPTQSGAQNLFQNAVPVVPGTTPAEQERDKFEDLKQFLINNVATTSWKDNGGDIGWISYAGSGKLLIRQTEATQSKIQNLLNLLEQDH